LRNYLVKEIESQTIEFKERLPEVATIYQAAFAGPPWREQLSFEEAMRRVEAHAEQKGFGAFLAHDHTQKIIGALWYDIVDITELREKKGNALADFTNNLSALHSIQRIIFTQDTIVDPTHQGKGIASKLKDTYIKALSKASLNSGIILTRHRDDNTGIIRTSEKHGFTRTGIRTPSSQNPKLSHEFWYKMIPS
jgi:RimJ/RimL family protein N-acetyltransferase